MTKQVGTGWPWLTDREIKLSSFTVSISSQSFFLWGIEKSSRSPSFFLDSLWKYLAPTSKEIAIDILLLLSEWVWQPTLSNDLLEFSIILFICPWPKPAETPLSPSLGTDSKSIYSGRQKISFHLSKVPSREQCWGTRHYRTYDLIVHD